MTPAHPDRRWHDRQSHQVAVEISLADCQIAARLDDISLGGLRFQVDPESLDFVVANIDTVRLGPGAPLAIRVIWGRYDGTIGATFKNPAAALPVVTAILRDHDDRAEAR